MKRTTILILTIFHSIIVLAQVDTSKVDDEMVYKAVDVDPVYFGGNSEFINQLVDKIRYPLEARDYGVEGKVYVKFVVEKDSSTSSHIVLNKDNVHPILQEEAIRVLSELNHWVPGKKNGEDVRSYFIYPVNFKMVEVRSKSEDKKIWNESEVDRNSEFVHGDDSAKVMIQREVFHKVNELELKDSLRVNLRFIVEKDGLCTFPYILNKDDIPEALYSDFKKAVLLLPRFYPAEVDSTFVRSFKDLTVVFPPFCFTCKAAEFPGGMGELYRWLGEQIEYPAIAMRNNYQGKIYVRFKILEDGSTTEHYVLNKGQFHESLEQEAIRVIKSTPKWIPGENNGVKVSTYFTLPINFKIG